MDAFNDDFVHEITFCAGTQLGKTAADQNMIGYAIAQDPAPMLFVYPSEKLAKFTSEKRLQPMIKLSPALAEKFDERGSKDLELSLGNMYIALVGANSPSELSSRPVRYIFFDEIDKFPKWTGAEAGPLELAAERTKTFYNRKIVKVSTPTLKTGNIWQGGRRRISTTAILSHARIVGRCRRLSLGRSSGRRARMRPRRGWRRTMSVVAAKCKDEQHCS